jgi:hypothetical protein
MFYSAKESALFAPQSLYAAGSFRRRSGMAKAKILSNPLAKLIGALSSASSTVPPVADSSMDSSSKHSAPHGLTADTNSKMQTIIGGEASAVGESTSATGNIYTRTFDTGAVKISFGVAEFKAAATAPGSNLTYAAADSYAAASGADIFLTHTKVASSTGQGSGLSYSGETSRTAYLAIDIAKVDLAHGPIMLGLTTEKSSSRMIGPSDGNVATLDIDAKAEAAHTYVGTNASALSLEDSLSTVSAIVITEVA